MEVTFCELREKEVVNIVSGCRMGRVCDIVVSTKSCRIIGVVVPGDRKILRVKEDIFIPWKCICKIGCDVILVELDEQGKLPEPTEKERVEE